MWLWSGGILKYGRPRSPDPRSADLGTPKTLKEFLFLVLFLLDKGEKVRLSDLKSKRAVAFLHGLGVNATDRHDG